MEDTSECFVCPDCSQPFSSLEVLEAHVADSHQSEEAEIPQQHSPSSSGDSQADEESHGLVCRYCQSVFEEQSQLSMHYTLMHRDKPHYTCSTCQAVFAVKRELSTHMRLHSGEQPHKCTQCGKEFGTRQLLKKHWMWHTGQRSHVCNHCNKAFFQKGHLTQHLMIHSGGRPHQCHLCQKTFIFKFDLNRHMKIHAERGFACQQCGRSFQRQVSLDEHVLKCKGRARSPAAASSLPSTPQPGFPFLPPSPLFSAEHMEKMAQSFLAQQRALSALLTPSAPIAPTPAPFFCLLCSQHFPNQQIFALHMYTTHMKQNSTREMKPSLTPEHGLAPIKMEEGNPGSVCDSSSTLSSCASSPQKVSPVSNSPSKCDGCESQRSRTAELEDALRDANEQVRKLRETMRLVLTSASQLLGQNSPENILQTGNIFHQLGNALSGAV